LGEEQTVTVAPLNRSLDQELAALIRGASLECLVCGEFVLHVRGALACPECRSILAESEERIAAIALPSVGQAG
jgi:Zn finger protein HypA/HybF involved in hydrogenase expression